MSGWWDQSGDLQYDNLVQKVPANSTMLQDEESMNRLLMNHLVASRVKVPEAVTREPGFHASALGYMCLRCEAFKRCLPRAAPEKSFPGSLLLRFELGSAVHDHWQNEVLARARVLKGTWSCKRCRFKLFGLLPTAPCPRCEWQIHPDTHARADERRMFMSCGSPDCTQTEYCPLCAEERETMPLFTIDCKAVCKWPTEDGFEDPSRDCGTCRRGGAWGFRETRIEIPAFDIVGHFDGVILYPDKPDRLLEMKTKDSFAWDNVVEPQAEHVMQSQVYMHGSGLREAVICYINKNSGLLKEFLVTYDSSFIELAKRNITEVRKSLEDGILPNGVCGGPREQRAKECLYSDVCFQGIDKISELHEKGIK